MSINVYKFIAGKNDNGRRVDRIMRKLYPEFPLSYIYKLIRKGSVLVNGKKCKNDTVILEFDTIEVYTEKTTITACLKNNTYKKNDEIKTNLDSSVLTIIFENDDIAIINKPKGIDVHGSNSIAEIAKYSFARESSLSYVPAPVHRLDRNTSGLLIIAKSLIGSQKTSEALLNKTLKKQYLAVLEGTINNDMVIEHFLERDKIRKITVVRANQTKTSHKAILVIHPLLSNPEYTLAVIDLLTGFTHQIRAQCSAIFHPLAGDKKYASKINIPHYFLHAWKLCNLNQLFSDCPSEILAPLNNEQVKYLKHYFHFAQEQISSLNIL